MIFKIIINIILSINIFLYGMENKYYFEKISHQVFIVFISISLLIYMIYIIKSKNKKILIINILYMTIITYIYPPSIVILIYLVSEYILQDNYNWIYIALLAYIIISIKINLDYTHIFLGTVSSLFNYVFINYEAKILNLNQNNYELNVI